MSIFQHVSRTIHEADGKIISSENALFITGMDYRGVQDLPPTTFLQGSRKPPCIPEDAFCALPYPRPSDESCPPENNLWINVPSKAHFSTPIKIQMLKREEIPSGYVKFSFAVTSKSAALSLGKGIAYPLLLFSPRSRHVFRNSTQQLDHPSMVVHQRCAMAISDILCRRFLCRSAARYWTLGVFFDHESNPTYGFFSTDICIKMPAF